MKTTILKMLRHKAFINKNFNQFIGKLKERRDLHDISKFQEDEFDGFAELDSKEVFKKYGTDEYGVIIKENKGINLHYSRNSHHPEHFITGAEGFTGFSEIEHMSFLDILEMVIDWKSACETYGTSFEESLEFSIKRFRPSEKTEHMIRMIASDLYGTKKP